MTDHAFSQCGDASPVRQHCCWTNSRCHANPHYQSLFDWFKSRQCPKVPKWRTALFLLAIAAGNVIDEGDINACSRDCHRVSLATLRKSEEADLPSLAGLDPVSRTLHSRRLHRQSPRDVLWNSQSTGLDSSSMPYSIHPLHFVGGAKCRYAARME